MSTETLPFSRKIVVIFEKKNPELRSRILYQAYWNLFRTRLYYESCAESLHIVLGQVRIHKQALQSSNGP